MFFRVIHGETIKDYSFDQQPIFTIGNSIDDNVCLNSSELAKGYFKARKDVNHYEIDCNGNKYTFNEGDQAIIIVLSMVDKISVFVISDYHQPKKVELPGSGSAIVIGRSNCDIDIKCTYLSKKHLKISGEDGSFLVQDLGSSNGTFLNGNRINESIIKENDEIVIGSVKIVLFDNRLNIFYNDDEIIINKLISHNLFRKAERNTTPNTGYFKRAPRLKEVIAYEKFDIEQVPDIGTRPELNKLQTFLTPCLTLFASVVMMFFNPLTLLFSLPMTIGSLIVNLSNHKKRVTLFEENTKKRYEVYTNYLNDMDKKIDNAYQKQLTAYRKEFPSVKSSIEMVKNRSKELWNRSYTDEDFLNISLGNCKSKLNGEISIPKEQLTINNRIGEFAILQKELVEKYSYLKDVPLACNLEKNKTLGIVGGQDNSINYINNLVMEMASLYSYTEVKFVVIADNSQYQKMKWMKKIPHCNEANLSLIATNKDEATKLFDSLIENLKSRKIQIEELNGGYGQNIRILPDYVFIFAQPTFLEKKNPLCDYLFNTQDIGVQNIFVVGSLANLPKECNVIVEVNKDSGKAYHKNDSANKRDFNIEYASQDELCEFGELIANIKVEDEVEEGGIPKKYDFFSMLNIKKINELDILKRWAASDITETMAVPIGIGENNKSINLDLLDYEKSHGPHGLIAGTTGSGKSETIQTYMASLAINFSPEEVAFLVIDFKGGGLANQFANLPHLLGVITNIGEDINRSLVSINAELKRRQKLFAEVNVNDIHKYITKRKKEKNIEAIPHLLIIVDEFAELRAEFPDFMKELVSAARIGRSLGVHLILSTQKPAGQVSDQIWTNSRFQICLKVASVEDSRDMIKSPLAYTIKEAGRAYLRVGNNEVFELFQSAYSGAKVKEGTTQLNEVVSKVIELCEENGIKSPSPICLPSLKEVIPYKHSIHQNDEYEFVSHIGIYDLPERQEQDEYFISMSKANTLIVGSVQTGKTNLLQLIIRDLSETYNSEEVNIYVIDFGAMSLRNFDGLKHIGAIATSNEIEKINNIIKYLSSEIVRRREVFSSLGISSYNSYLEANKKDMPLLVLLVDNYVAFGELYPNMVEEFELIARDGLSFGISVTIATPRSNGLGYKFLQYFSQRVAFACNDDNEYNSLFDRSRLHLPNIRGRAFAKLNFDIVLLQTYLCFSQSKEIERANAMRNYVMESNDANNHERAHQVIVVPEVVDEMIMAEFNLSSDANNYVIPLGIDFNSQDSYVLNLMTDGALMLMGGENGERHNLIKKILTSLQKNIFSNYSEVYLIDRNIEYDDVYEYPVVKEHTQIVLEASSYIRSVYEELKTRRDNYAKIKNKMDTLPMLILVIDDNEMLRQLCSSSEISNILNEIAKDLHVYKGYVVLGDVMNEQLGVYSFPILKYCKEHYCLIAFEEIDNIRVVDVPSKLASKYNGTSIRKDAGFSFVGSYIRKVQFIDGR